MNRVAEALRRAAKENAQPDVASSETPQPDVASSETPQQWVQEITALAHKANGSTPIATPVCGEGTKTRLRKTLEELVFGWDLRNLKEFPLFALEKHSPAAEQYKILREQVRKKCNERKIDLLLVTSPIKGDGKTTVAANLATALALDYEEEVLIIDTDMRSPSLSSYFSIQSAPGLSDFLVSNTETEPTTYVQDTFLPGLRIFPAGHSSINAAELLTTDKMKKLLEFLRQKFPGHRILIDTAPVLSTSDPLVLARHVDGIMMVVRAGHTPRDFVSKAIKCLDAKQLLGVILNGTELGTASKYYYPRP